MSNAYFIAGTDTGIGKTLVGLSLLRLAAADGRSTLGLKPVSAGCDDYDGTLMNEDARELMLASTTGPDYATVNPLAAVSTSPGLVALPPGMFSVGATIPMTRVGRSSEPIARMAPMAVAGPVSALMSTSLQPLMKPIVF